MGLWEAVGQFEDSQTAIVTTAMLIVGGGIGVLMGSWLFGGRVKDLQSALDQSVKAINEHGAKTNEKLLEMNEQLASTMAALGQLKGAVSDIQTEAAAAEEVNALPADHQLNELRTKLKENWYSIRDELWRRANDPAVHGKTRAKYSKFGNYELGELVSTMKDDGNLDDRIAKLFRDAIEFWAWHRNGRAPLSQADVQTMREYKIQLVAQHNG
ncbi:hypothetical protein [Hyphomonas sp.]|uniref:hypothetical protein n=1 Tax=Hyphomonas sp. TaxID=87 RepID=UPI0025C3EAC5|nr:hypothetical protein [Hyphomonas sp.]